MAYWHYRVDHAVRSLEWFARASIDLEFSEAAPLTKRDVLGLCGAWRDSIIRGSAHSGLVTLVVSNPVFLHPSQVSLILHEGRWVMRLGYLALLPAFTGKGIGCRLLFSQIAAASGLGITAIIADAIAGGTEPGNRAFNGLYTLARLGFDSALSQEWRAKYSGAERISDIVGDSAMRSRLRNEREGLQLVFDTRSGSRSWRVLHDYLDRRKLWAGLVVSNV